mgnify:CR=1 FL=1
MGKLVIEYPNCRENSEAVARFKREIGQSKGLLFNVRCGGIKFPPCELLGMGLDAIKRLNRARDRGTAF